MLTSELIAVLQQRLATHGDREVVVTWESITNPLYPGSVYLSKKGPLYIDAEGGDRALSKIEFAADLQEGEERLPLGTLWDAALEWGYDLDGLAGLGVDADYLFFNDCLGFSIEAAGEEWA